MKSYEKEKYYSGYPLNRVKPVARVWVTQIVRSRLGCDYQAIDRVINQRNENTADFDKQNVRNRLEVFDCVIEIRRAR